MRKRKEEQKERRCRARVAISVLQELSGDN